MQPHELVHLHRRGRQAIPSFGMIEVIEGRRATLPTAMAPLQGDEWILGLATCFLSGPLSQGIVPLQSPGLIVAFELIERKRSKIKYLDRFSLFDVAARRS